MNKKIRLDLLLVKKGIFPTREKARGSIMAGLVSVNGQRSDKPGQVYIEEVEIGIKGTLCPYVSRGGMKLEKALREFNIKVKESIVLDIGASTGGFTDCMLTNGASRVYAVDVGYGQLAWKLRNDQRVINIERTNARYISSDHIPEHVNIISLDVSFISLTKILPVAREFLLPGGKIIALVKPQFEAGKNQVGKGGVVKKKEVHIKVLNDIVSFCNTIELYPVGIDYSPLQGPAGNIEFLLCLDRMKENIVNISDKIVNCVTKAHEEFFTVTSEQ
jgi:23S rRNA (cytidine1920-2'-O)/16S rRNA (cytidine1409-2'-O)-methyltransferase